MYIILIYLPTDLSVTLTYGNHFFKVIPFLLFEVIIVITVFNNSSTNSEGTLFLREGVGQGVSIQRFDNPKYPHLLKLLETGMGFYWQPEEIATAIDASNFPKLSEAEKHVVISNIKSQIFLDSIMGRAPDIIFGPAISDPILEALVKWWSTQEMIHSKSYTYIIQNSFTNPKEVIDGVMDLESIIKRSNTIVKHYDNCTLMVEKYNKGECSRIEAIKAIGLALHCANTLEAIRFCTSFATSFAFAERGILPGLGNIISLINRDEKLHYATTTHLLKILPLDDKDFAEVYKDKDFIDSVREIWRTTYFEELEWVDYLFSKGDIFGLNKVTLSNYLNYITTSRLDVMNIGTMEEITGHKPIRDNPIKWINNWLSNKDNQPAPQETELTNYEKGVVDMTNISMNGLVFEE